MTIRFLSVARQELDDAFTWYAHLHREPRYWIDRLASEGEEQGGEFRASDKPPTKPARRRSRKP